MSFARLISYNFVCTFPASTFWIHTVSSTEGWILKFKSGKLEIGFFGKRWIYPKQRAKRIALLYIFAFRISLHLLLKKSTFGSNYSVHLFFPFLLLINFETDYLSLWNRNKSIHLTALEIHLWKIYILTFKCQQILEIHDKNFCLKINSSYDLISRQLPSHLFFPFSACCPFHSQVARRKAFAKNSLRKSVTLKCPLMLFH